MNYHKDTVIAEVSGRDSIASIISYAGKNPGCFILPSVVITPPEDKMQREISSYLDCLQHYVFSMGSFVYAPIFQNVDSHWWAANKFIDAISKEYGFYTPCIQCHGLVHAARIPLAKKLGKKVITGERYLHGDMEKLNQDRIVIDAYDRVFEDNDIEVVRPFLETMGNTEIEKMVGDFESVYFIEGFSHIGCALSKNIDKHKVKEKDLKRYCMEYVIPMMEEVIRETEEDEWGLKM